MPVVEPCLTAFVKKDHSREGEIKTLYSSFESRYWPPFFMIEASPNVADVDGAFANTPSTRYILAQVAKNRGLTPLGYSSDTLEPPF
jgi:hypothetical protein